MSPNSEVRHHVLEGNIMTSSINIKALNHFGWTVLTEQPLEIILDGVASVTGECAAKIATMLSEQYSALTEEDIEFAQMLKARDLAMAELINHETELEAFCMKHSIPFLSSLNKHPAFEVYAQNNNFIIDTLSKSSNEESKKSRYA